MSLIKYTNRGQNTRLWQVYLKSVVKYGTLRKIVNAVRTEIAYRRREVIVRSSPYILFLEPLYYCNLACPLCDREVFKAARKDDAGKLSLELYDRILSEVGDFLFQCQIFGQGEPLMNWKLTRQIIDRTRERNIFTLMSTNCTLITAEIADGLATSGLDHLVCAIDGVTQESYETYRVGGKLEDAMSGMRMVVESRRRHRSKLQIEWQFLVHAHNEHEIPAARTMATELGVGFRLAPLSGMEWDAEAEDFWKPNRGPWAKRATVGRAANDFPCYFLWRSLVLNSNGKVARCLVYQNASQYVDLHKSSVSEAYNHPSVQAARRLFRKESFGNAVPPEPCMSCGKFARHHGDQIIDRNSVVLRDLGTKTAKLTAPTNEELHSH